MDSDSGECRGTNLQELASGHAMSESLSDTEQDSDLADVNEYAVSLPECSYSSVLIMLHTMCHSSVPIVVRALVVFPEVASCVLIVAVQLLILTYLWDEIHPWWMLAASNQAQPRSL